MTVAFPYVIPAEAGIQAKECGDAIQWAPTSGCELRTSANTISNAPCPGTKRVVKEALGA